LVEVVFDFRESRLFLSREFCNNLVELGLSLALVLRDLLRSSLEHSDHLLVLALDLLLGKELLLSKLLQEVFDGLVPLSLQLLKLLFAGLEHGLDALAGLHCSVSCRRGLINGDRDRLEVDVWTLLEDATDLRLVAQLQGQVGVRIELVDELDKVLDLLLFVAAVHHLSVALGAHNTRKRQADLVRKHHAQTVRSASVAEETGCLKVRRGVEARRRDRLLLGCRQGRALNRDLLLLTLWTVVWVCLGLRDRHASLDSPSRSRLDLESNFLNTLRLFLFLVLGLACRQLDHRICRLLRIELVNKVPCR